MSNIPQPAGDAWEAVYYTNPIPLSSRCLTASAILFDRLHIPGVSIPQVRISGDEKRRLKREWLPGARGPTPHKLGLWAMEQPDLSEFIYLPDHPFAVRADDDVFNKLTGQLLDDTYGAGTSAAVEGLVAGEIFRVPGADSSVLALTWPSYQARALQYSQATGLPLFSDDLALIPPFPRHPHERPDTKALAQQLAVQAVSLVLPPLRSVDPNRIAEFRSAVQPLAKPFRLEMIKLTADVSAAMAAGEGEAELTRLCRNLAESRVLPALADLSTQLSEPVKPWSKIALEVLEAGLAVHGTTELTVAWALLRGTKIASDYVRLFLDRRGKKRSGLSYLLKVHKQAAQGASEWDTRDWRCSGYIYLPDPGAVIASQHARLLPWAASENRATTTMRCVQQTTSKSVIWFRGRPEERPGTAVEWDASGEGPCRRG